MTDFKKKVVWIVWILLWPTAFISVFLTQPPKIDGDYLSILGMAILMIVSTFFYFKLGDRDIIVVEAVVIATFLIFGLFVEMVITQLMVVTYTISKRFDKETLYKLPLNFLMFLCVSLFSASVYFLLGGSTGALAAEQPLNLFPILVYGICTFISNQVLIFLIAKYLSNQGYRLDKELLWEAAQLCLVIPIAIVLYLLYSDMGGKSLFFVAIPIVTLSVIFQLVHKGYSMNRLLQVTSDVGRELAEKLDVNHILDLFFNRIQNMIDVDYAYLLTRNEHNQYDLSYKFDEDANISQFLTPKKKLNLGDLHIKESLRFNNQKLIKRYFKCSLSKPIQSAILIPFKYNANTGIFVVASKRKRVYEKHHMIMLKILTNFLIVAIENARDYEKTKFKSERDPLTNLYNYRFFSEMLDQMYVDIPNAPFSIIMIDLDHFKRINDTYGHESGNSILCGVAKRLLSIVEEKGIVARYGGEEFIILLPNSNIEKSYTVAEDIRIRLSKEPFMIYADRTQDSRRLVHITASIGVATAPIQGEDPMSLIRNADRAMYSGAKQQGRNRVAAYTG